MLEFQTFGDGPEGRAYIAPEHVAAVESAGSANVCRVTLSGGDFVMLRGTPLDVAGRIANAKGVSVLGGGPFDG